MDSETLKEYISQRGKHVLESAPSILFNKNNTGVRKTGTTICGMICRDGVVLGADTRETIGESIEEKYCLKLEKVSNKIYCAGSGVSADLYHMCLLMKKKCRLWELETGKSGRTDMITYMISSELSRYRGHKQCGIIIGGYDVNGPSIYQISPCGSTANVPYAALGSGSLLAYSVLENEYKDNMSFDEATEVIKKAILAGVYNDLYSGGSVDICKISPEGSKFIRGIYNVSIAENVEKVRPNPIPRGTTAIKTEKIYNWRSLVNISEENIVGT